MKLSDIRPVLPINISKNLSFGRISELIRHIQDKRREIDFDIFLPSINKNLQRDFCWTTEQKSELILSIIKGINIPNMTIIIYTPSQDKPQFVFKIIDGKQRLSTILDFCDNKFPVKLLCDDYFYNDLPNDIKYVIDYFHLTVNCTYEYWDDLIPDKIKIEWFEQINFAGTPQDISHLNNLKNLL